MASDDRVLLNVGGSRFEVPRKTLSRFPASLLGPLAAPEVESELVPEANGEYFFDRNGRFFEFILEYYRSGLIAPPADMTRQQVLAELQYWNLNADPYLASVEGDTRIRNYVEAPVDVPLEQQDPNDILDELAEMPVGDRMRVDMEFVRHPDTDLVQVGLTDLSMLEEKFREDKNLASSAAHLEALYFLALGHYRLGQIRVSRELVDKILRIDGDYQKAKDLQILLADSSTNYSRLGILALGVAIIGAAAFKVWSWSSTAAKATARK